MRVSIPVDTNKRQQSLVFDSEDFDVPGWVDMYIESRDDDDGTNIDLICQVHADNLLSAAKAMYDEYQRRKNL
jgi:hypothetical protein